MAKRKKEEVAEPRNVERMSKSDLVKEALALSQDRPENLGRKQLEKLVTSLRKDNPKLVQEMVQDQQDNSTAQEGEGE